MTLETAEIRFRHRPPGRFWDWHNESRRQYSSILFGTGSRSSSVMGRDGGSVLVNVVLTEDLTGQGHTTRIVSEVPFPFGVCDHPRCGEWSRQTQGF